jgi:glycosyltransferase involved in cell wall biosynthesis
MKVLYCILDNRFGGPHRLALTAAARLHGQGVETLFLLGCKTQERWRPAGFESFLCRHIQCFVRRRPLLHLARFCCFLPYNVLKVRRLIRRHAIDVVHIDGVTNFVPALAAALTRTPIVWLYNDHLLGPLRRLLLPLLTRLAATVIVQGEELREVRTGFNPRLRDKTVVLYPGVDLAEFDPARYDAGTRARLRAEWGVPPDGLLIGTIGNINRFKGYTYFLQAARLIKEQAKTARFLIVGRKLDTDPGYWEQLQRLAAEGGLADSVTYTGFREDVPAVLSALDVFVLPSVLESCPNVVLEAMAMKVPVVATDVGATSEQLIDGATGLLVPSADAAALAAAVLAYLRKPRAEVDRMLRAARQRAEQVFSLDKTVERQKHLYAELVKS